MKNNKSGFSLIELSVVLIIIGVLLVGLLQAYRVYDEKQKIERMKLAMATVEQSIRNFPNMVDPATVDPATGIGKPYGRLPCPAPMNGTGAGNDFDSENCTSPTNPSGSPQVMVGKLPAATLGLHNDSMRDIYGNYLLYAVSTPATATSTYGSVPGNITVIEEGTDRNPSSPTLGQIIPLETHSNVQFTVISMGRESQGAYAFDGSQPTPCPPSAVKEHENCNGDAVFLSSYRHNASVNNTYDDNIIFASNLTAAAKTKQPGSCEQIELFATSATACPDGWSEEALPAPANRGNPYNYARPLNYNVDPETGDFFFTSETTPYTVTPTAAAGRRGLTCRKNPGNAATNKCFNEKIVAWDESVDDDSGRPRGEVCPDGWVLINDRDTSCRSDDAEDNDRSDVMTWCTTTRYCGRM